MKTKKRNFNRGDIVWVDLGQHPGSHICHFRGGGVSWSIRGVLIFSTGRKVSG